MTRSRKNKSSQKMRKKQNFRGGGIHYDQYLKQAEDDILAAEANYHPTKHPTYGSSFWADAEDPIEIPGEGMYIGEFYLWDYLPIMSGTGMLTSFEKDEKTGLPKFIKEGDWKNSLENGYFIILYGNEDVVNVHMEKGRVLPSWTEKGRKGEGDLASQYTYSNGQIYQGDLILKRGKIVPANDLTPPRTVFNFAPGPTVVYTREGKTIKIPPREAERGFRMSQDPDFVPRAPPNSPQSEKVVVRRGTGLRGRLSGIRDSRLTSVEESSMDKEQELADIRKITSMQTGLKPLPSLERKSALPAITRKDGKYRGGRKTRRK